MERDFWQRYTVGWHAILLVLLATTVVLTALAGGGAIRTAVVGVLAAATACWYALYGKEAFEARNTRMGLRYLPIAWALFTAMVWVAPTCWVLLFILYPQLFVMMDERRWWLPGSFLLAFLYVAASTRLSGLTGGITVFLVLGPPIAIAFGSWVGGMSKESTRRAKLAAELADTRAELLKAHHREGVLAERERLAHEIHDTLAQGFTSLHMLIRGAETALKTDPDAARERLLLAERTATENLAEARSLVAALGPTTLRQASLPDALVRLVDRFTEEAGTTTATFQLDGTARPLSADQEVIIVRIVQEALANIRKHARAHQATVRLTYEPDGVELRISDDGQGFTVSEPASASASADMLGGGFGLRGMRARAVRIGGVLDVTSRPGVGTTVTVSL